MDGSVPRLTLLPVEDARAAAMLEQTKSVYDQLLMRRHDKMLRALLDQKASYDEECNAFLSRDPDRALEYAVRAQEVVNQENRKIRQELEHLAEDYQTKLDAMRLELTSKPTAQGYGNTAMACVSEDKHHNPAAKSGGASSECN